MTEQNLNTEPNNSTKPVLANRYYFKSTGFNNDTATERCMFKDNGIMIGSVACQKCIFCIEHENPCDITGEVNWIICSKIKLAKG